MVQGLLGGLRVRLNDLIGTDLAAVHGTFATLVLALLDRDPGPDRPAGRRAPLPDVARRKLALADDRPSSLFTLVQIGWGAWSGTCRAACSTRMHLLFAFVVVGFATLAIKQALVDPASQAAVQLAGDAS